MGSDKLKTTTEMIGLFVGIIAGLSGLALSALGVFYLLPYRVQAVETKIDAAEGKLESVAQQRQADRELLTRIEERLIAVQNELRKRDP